MIFLLNKIFLQNIFMFVHVGKNLYVHALTSLFLTLLQCFVSVQYIHYKYSKFPKSIGKKLFAEVQLRNSMHSYNSSQKRVNSYVSIRIKQPL